MSFVFRAFTKSRRRKHKDDRPSSSPSSTYMANLAGISKSYSSDDRDLPSSRSRSFNANKVKYPQQILLVGSQTDDDDDDGTHPLHEPSPSYGSNTSSSGRFSPLEDRKVHHNNQKSSRSSGNFLSSSSSNLSTEPSKRPLFKSRRHKSNPKNNYQHPSVSSTPSQSQTPETVATARSTPHTNAIPSDNRLQSSPPTVKRGAQSRFSEIYTPTKSVTRKLTFQEPDRAEYGPDHVFDRQSPLPSGKKASDLKRGRRSKPLLVPDHKVKSKTLIMNGDIVVCASQISNDTSDTATTVSAASSKARALRREAERIARAAASLDNKGNELFERGHFDKAMSCYSKALKLKRRTFAHLLEEADDMEEQLMMCEEKKADPQMLVSMATSINNIAYLRQRNGDATIDETAAAYKKSLKIKRRILGNDSLSVGKTLNNIGSVHYLKREFDQALPAYEEALKIMKANLGDKHSDVATVISNIGDVYLGQGNPEISLLKYRQSLAIRWEAFGEKDPRVIRLLEKIAKVEIGDRMLTPSLSRDGSRPSWDNDEASEVMAEGTKPISDELKNLQEEIARDIEDVSLMERKATVEMLKDKIIIIRGMRAIWEGTGPELLDNDTASVITGGKSLKGLSME